MLFEILYHVVLVILSYYVNNGPQVHTIYGILEGTKDGISRDGKEFLQFRGIQYAIVKQRFSASATPESWYGVKSAKEFGARCDQVHVHGNENCLFLNVYTRKINPNTNDLLLPVLVYIHGGSFRTNAGELYGPNYMMDEDVVFVTLNYRLAALGFLSTGDKISPGNYGLKDQTMALRWVQDNIEVFGGDKNAVTIMGQSAGSASVTYHLLSPMSKGLYKSAIAASGTFLDPWQSTRKPIRYALKLAEAINCTDTTTSTAIVSCLRDAPAEIVGNLQLIKNITRKFFEDPIAPFGPVIEPADAESTFLTKSPYESLVNGEISQVPLLTGLTMEEGIYIWAGFLLHNTDFLANISRENLHSNWNSIAPKAFYFDEKMDPERLSEISLKIQNFYFQTNFSGCDLRSKSTLSKLSRLYSDRMFVTSVIRFINLYAKLAPTYAYLYAYNKEVGLEFGFEELHKKFVLDPTHGAELDMFFSPLFQKRYNSLEHNQASRSIMKLWMSFIQTGVPSATYGTATHFPPVDPKIGINKWYRLDIDTKLEDNIFAKRTAFWESLGLTDNDFYNCYC